MSHEAERWRMQRTHHNPLAAPEKPNKHVTRVIPAGSATVPKTSAVQNLPVTNASMPICGARTRNGAVCQALSALDSSGRCRLHATPSQVCGALTPKGTLCGNLNIGRIGLCPAHTSGMISNTPVKDTPRVCGAPVSPGRWCRVFELTPSGRCTQHAKLTLYDSENIAWSRPLALVGEGKNVRTGVRTAQGSGVKKANAIAPRANKRSSTGAGVIPTKSAVAPLDTNASRNATDDKRLNTSFNSKATTAQLASAGSMLGLCPGINANKEKSAMKAKKGGRPQTAPVQVITANTSMSDRVGKPMHTAVRGNMNSSRVRGTLSSGNIRMGDANATETVQKSVTGVPKADTLTRAGLGVSQTRMKGKMRKTQSSHEETSGRGETLLLGTTIEVGDISPYWCGAPTVNGKTCRSLNLTANGLCPAHVDEWSAPHSVTRTAKKPLPMCGAITQKGTPCRNPYIMKTGRCVYHSKEVNDSLIRKGALPEAVGKTFPPTIKTQAVPPSSRADASKLTKANDVKTGLARACGVITQKGTPCRNIRLTCHGVCAVHVSKLKAKGAPPASADNTRIRADKSICTEKDLGVNTASNSGTLPPSKKKECGTPTEKGTLCRSPFLTEYGLCPLHTFQLKRKGAVVALVAAGNTVHDVVSSLSRTAEKPRSAFTMRPGQFCAARTARGAMCRNPYLSRFGVCYAHTIYRKSNLIGTSAGPNKKQTKFGTDETNATEMDMDFNLERSQESSGGTNTAPGVKGTKMSSLDRSTGPVMSLSFGKVAACGGLDESGNSGKGSVKPRKFASGSGRMPSNIDVSAQGTNGACGAETALGGPCQNPKPSLQSEISENATTAEGNVGCLGVDEIINEDIANVETPQPILFSCYEDIGSSKRTSTNNDRIIVDIGDARMTEIVSDITSQATKGPLSGTGEAKPGNPAIDVMDSIVMASGVATSKKRILQSESDFPSRSFEGTKNGKAANSCGTDDDSNHREKNKKRKLGCEGQVAKRHRVAPCDQVHGSLTESDRLESLGSGNVKTQSSTEEQQREGGSGIIEFVRKNLYFNPIRTVFRYFQGRSSDFDDT